MEPDDIEIGRPLQVGERIQPVAGDIRIMIDSDQDHEVILIARDEERTEIVDAGPDAPYSVERYDHGCEVTIRPSRMIGDLRYVLGAYSSNGTPNILATISDPRVHLALPRSDSAAVSIYEFYEKQDWRIKADGGRYAGGLQAMLSS